MRTPPKTVKKCKVCSSEEDWYDPELEIYTCDSCGSSSPDLVEYKKCQKKSTSNGNV